ncbi:MAG: M48 family metalloprotease [Elainellaceae cyanobacterium]
MNSLSGSLKNVTNELIVDYDSESKVVAISSPSSATASPTGTTPDSTKTVQYFPIARGGRRGNNPIAILFLLVIGPLAAGLLRMAISRTREYAADAGAAEITGKPLSLAKALETLESMGQKVPIHGNPAFEPLFIVNPLSKEGLMTLFMTHPSTEDRIKRLKELAENAETSEAGNTTLSPST